VLAFDAGSPLASVALARGDRVVAESSIERAASPESLLSQIDSVLADAGAAPASLGALCVLRGPGSFTGLRIALATALGLRQALQLRVAALPTLRVLAETDESSAAVVAVVDALRGEWFVQAFHRSSGGLEPAAPAELLPGKAFSAPARVPVIGFGAARLAAAAGLDPVQTREPPPLAGVAARLAPRWTRWDPAHLTEPLYLRPAATTPPRRGRRRQRP
jgi:tRNA threonylcarbamoyladenosine biosynthesis protein TsaB